MRQAFSENFVQNILFFVVSMQIITVKNSNAAVLRIREEWLEFSYG
jgi:hypothetical protein